MSQGKKGVAIVRTGCIACFVSVCGLLSGVVQAQGTIEPLAMPPAAGVAAPAASPKDMGYAMGFRIGQQLRAEHDAIASPIDTDGLAQGLADAVTGQQPKLTAEVFRAALGALEAVMRQKEREMVERLQAAAKDNLVKGAAYLKQKAGEAGVKQLPNGILYEVLAEGTGPQPTLDDIVVARYAGTHIDGTAFDSTDPKGPPAEFPLRQVVSGWQEVLPHMKAGSKWRIHLPPEFGYGAEGSAPAIAPNEVLVFEIELIGSQPAPQR